MSPTTLMSDHASTALQNLAFEDEHNVDDAEEDLAGWSLMSRYDDG
jgi:hypothetical protein